MPRPGCSGFCAYDLGPYIPGDGEHYALLKHVLSLGPNGTALEFGVGAGQSTRLIAAHMPVIGFDSFQGLPEDWRHGYQAGAFAQQHPPAIDNADYVIGWYEDTLPAADFREVDRIGLVHIDCDLYSATKTVLDHIGRGCFIVFDEWHGFDGARPGTHEQRAWREFADHTGITWRVVGHGHQQWSIQIA
ncbi:TylF/MycF family methyltransferase [Mycobacterium sp. PSTR-4-N]|uniref:TylF/MycF family methyltransferase n=1 Tax=Mycobacterium sp. PSTR-4-N TaxID=2917745 RepID=UPI001F15283B|nr:TylF/MycF family methyltransferase [Mycobacterium sp. PSTR-4-N]MCG7592405.1 TylF/MycF family methyltransferase [Mycobacterium sp. PSTR-4-N]